MQLRVGGKLHRAVRPGVHDRGGVLRTARTTGPVRTAGPARTTRPARTAGGRDVHGDGVGRAQRTVVGGERQHVVAGLAERRGGVDRGRVGEAHRGGPGLGRPLHRLRRPGQAVVGDAAVERGSVGQGDAPIGPGVDDRRSVDRRGGGHLELQDQHRRCQTVLALGGTPTRPGEQQGRRVACGPAGPVHDLLQDRRQLRGELGRALLTDHLPGRRGPRHLRGRPGPRGEVPGRGQERCGVVGGLSGDGEARGVGAHLVCLELHLGAHDLPTLGDRQVDEAQPQQHRLGGRRSVVADLVVGAREVDEGPAGPAALLRVVGTGHDRHADRARGAGVVDLHGQVVEGAELSVADGEPQQVGPRRGEGRGGRGRPGGSEGHRADVGGLVRPRVAQRVPGVRVAARADQLGGLGDVHHLVDARVRDGWEVGDRRQARGDLVDDAVVLSRVAVVVQAAVGDVVVPHAGAVAGRCHRDAGQRLGADARQADPVEQRAVAGHLVDGVAAVVHDEDGVARRVVGDALGVDRAVLGQVVLRDRVIGAGPDAGEGTVRAGAEPVEPGTGLPVEQEQLARRGVVGDSFGVGVAEGRGLEALGVGHAVVAGAPGAVAPG